MKSTINDRIGFVAKLIRNLNKINEALEKLEDYSHTSFICYTKSRNGSQYIWPGPRYASDIDIQDEIEFKIRKIYVSDLKIERQEIIKKLDEIIK